MDRFNDNNIFRMTPIGGKREKKLIKPPEQVWFHLELSRKEELFMNEIKREKTVEANQKVSHLKEKYFQYSSFKTLNV